MIADEIRTAAHRKPFVPFKVRPKSGESLEIQSRFRATVVEPMAVFGVDVDPQTRIARIVNVNDIVAVERL
jgi:hypothetical protein